MEQEEYKRMIEYLVKKVEDLNNTIFKQNKIIEQKESMINELIKENAILKDMSIDEVFSRLERKCRCEMDLMEELNNM